MKLFYNPASPFVRKVLVTAIECQLDNKISKQPLALTPVAPSDALNADNPLGKIPALVLDDGSTLMDSRVICEYLNDLGRGNLFPADNTRWQTLRWQSIADGMCDAAVAVRYETFVRPQQHQWEQWINNQKDKYRRALAVLESEAAEFGNKVDIGTLSIAIALDYIDFRYADEAWRDVYPALSAWHQLFSSRDSLAQTMPKDLSL